MYQFWRFVAAGLYKEERRWVYRFAPLMVLLFGSGVFFGFRVLIPEGLRFLLSYGDPSVVGSWTTLPDYLNLFMLLTLVLGVTFQLPVVMALLAKVGMFTAASFRAKRRYFILGAFVVGALLTPPDVVTQCLMATPLLFLFEFGVFLAWLAEGPGRSAINWKMWGKRGLIALLIAAILWLFWDAIQASYRARDVSNRLVAEDGEGIVPYISAFQATSFINDGEVSFAYRVDAIEDQELFAVGTEASTWVAELNFSDNRLQVTAQEGETTRFILIQGGQGLAIRHARSRAEEALERLLKDAAAAKPEQASSLLRLAAGLLENPSASLRPPSDASEDDIDTAIEAWRRWREATPEWAYKKDG